jgi:predicted DNA-binding transcriptional regulator YafY
MDETNPTARALRAMQVLQDHPGITASGLGERLGVTDRAARRYVAVLREAGVPVESVRGPYGGYRMGRGLRLPPVVFDGSEALALVMAVLDGHHDAGDSGDPVGVALDKVMRALPPRVAAQAEAVRRTAATAPDRRAARPDPDTTAALVHACAEQRRVLIGYRTEAGSERDLLVDPWAVVVRHGRWYLLCWSHAPAARRTYRIDRVRSAQVLGDTFEVPDDLDPVADLEAHLASGWEYDAEVLVDAPLPRVAACVPRALGRLEVVDPGTTRLVGTTSNPGWYAEMLAALPAPYRILGGPEVRDAARALARRMLDACGAGEPHEPGRPGSRPRQPVTDG